MIVSHMPSVAAYREKNLDNSSEMWHNKKVFGGRKCRLEAM